MKLDSLPEAVEVTIFMEGLRNGFFFRVHPSSFEEAGYIAASSGILRAELIRLSLWISTILERKRSFKLLISNVTSEDVIREEARSTFVLSACSESSTSADRIIPRPEVKN